MLIPIEVEAEKVFGECGHFEHVVWPDSYLQCITKYVGMYLQIHKPLDVKIVFIHAKFILVWLYPFGYDATLKN